MWPEAGMFQAQMQQMRLPASTPAVHVVSYFTLKWTRLGQ